MADLDHERPDASPGASPNASIAETFSRLRESGTDYARAEWAKQTLRAKLAAAAGRDAAILFAVALVLLFAALVALLIGLVVALSPMLTPLGAAVAVPVAAIAVAALVALAAKARITRMLAEISE